MLIAWDFFLWETSIFLRVSTRQYDSNELSVIKFCFVEAEKETAHLKNHVIVVVYKRRKVPWNFQNFFGGRQKVVTFL